MDTLEDIKIYLIDMTTYCDVISAKSSVNSKIAFTHLMGMVAKRIAKKCDKLEKELESAEQDK